MEEIPVQKSGRVVMADGSPLPESVDVEIVCGTAKGRLIARTDAKGGFSVGSGISGATNPHRGLRGTGRGAGVPGSAETGSVHLSALAGCVLQAVLPGYRSSSVRVVDDHAPDAGTIVLSRRPGVEGNTFSGTALNAPPRARKNFEKARQALRKNRPDRASRLLEEAVEEYPEYAAAWFELGKVRQAANDLPRARHAFEQAVQADTKYVPPYLTLAAIHASGQNWKDTVETAGAVIRLDPFGYPAAYAMHARGSFHLGNYSVAEASCRRIQELGAESAFPEVEYMLGVMAATRGDTEKGTEHLERFLRLAPGSPGAEAVRAQIAEWRKKN